MKGRFKVIAVSDGGHSNLGEEDLIAYVARLEELPLAYLLDPIRFLKKKIKGFNFSLKRRSLLHRL